MWDFCWQVSLLAANSEVSFDTPASGKHFFQLHFCSHVNFRFTERQVILELLTIAKCSVNNDKTVVVMIEGVIYLLVRPVFE